MELTRKLDEHGKGAWIAVMVLSFILFWPAGLAILAYLIWSGRMSCWKHGGPGRWYYSRRRNKHDGDHEGRAYHGASSGNSAFDDYREETLKRLEDEQREFESFLEQLRHAKDKAEFDQFMNDRKSRPQDPPQDQPRDQPGA
ncbi:MAG: DUF2852 domain-containing protein [Alphaproteobacteria bacterium]|jgi:hypothetical protein|nr:DUF2852 domain-containing protein [Alphaproteobacteria bacterium]